ncbi:Butyrophilin subfamily 3 member A3 [Tupaia chinensis]|uniref:Butyrophilin subfamily 3 member A3 n=1 Tax=Tupaia chinensis TaxID=246437 RepID=L8YAI5_TUPCH|nr:Butyrophilin subfamily 3 member A3 [Tupaia chinensis]
MSAVTMDLRWFCTEFSEVVVLGRDATLPCSLSLPMSAVTMEQWWFHTEFSEVVLSFRDQQEQKEEQLAQYAERASLVRDFLAQGEAAVRIHKVWVSDNGLYTCFFRKGGFYKEANLELQVAEVGSAPQVHIRGPEEDGVRVGCKILNPVLGQERTTAIFIPEPFFPQASPWKPAFVVSLTVLGLLLCGAGCFLMRERSARLQRKREWKRVWLEKEEAQQAKEEELKASDELQATLRERKAAYLAGE